MRKFTACSKIQKIKNIKYRKGNIGLLLGSQCWWRYPQTYVVYWLIYLRFDFFCLLIISKCFRQESSAPVGPLFYSGIIKSRALAHIKKCLQDTATYHHNEAEAIKAEQQVSSASKSTKTKKSTAVIDDAMFPTLSIIDFTGESSDSSSESEFSEEEEGQKTRCEETTGNSFEERKRDRYNLLCYHEGAEKWVKRFSNNIIMVLAVWQMFCYFPCLITLGRFWT